MDPLSFGRTCGYSGEACGLLPPKSPVLPAGCERERPSTAWATLLRLGVCWLGLTLVLCGCGRPDNRNLDSLGSSIRARAALVQTLKAEGKISESGRGYLRSNPGIYLDIPDRRIVEEENHERGKVFTLLAREYQLPKRNIEAIFVKKSSSAP